MQKFILKSIFLLLPFWALSSDTFAQNFTSSFNNNWEAITLELHDFKDEDGCTSTANVNFNDIRFAYDSAELLPEAAGQIATISRALKEFWSDSFVIEGHTDAKGTKAYNIDLSYRRAETIKRALIATGIAEDQLYIRGFGESRLLFPDQPLHAHNRRVGVMRVSPNSAKYALLSAGTQGENQLSAQLRSIDEVRGIYYVMDPKRNEIHSGEKYYLCVSSSSSGILEIEAKGPDETEFTSLGAWYIPKENVIRAPENHVLSVDDTIGYEIIRLKHYACGDGKGACPNFDADNLAHNNYENIRLGRFKDKPNQALAVDYRCDSKGVTCATMRLNHIP